MPVRRHPVALSNEQSSLATVPLDQALIERLRESYQRIRASDLRFAEMFYARLFQAAPHLRPLFPSDPTVQSRKLMASLDFIIDNLAAPEKNTQMLRALGRRHAGYGAEAAHFDLVMELMIGSLRDLLAPALDEQTLGEWRTALRLVSNQMIEAMAGFDDAEASGR